MRVGPVERLTTAWSSRRPRWERGLPGEGLRRAREVDLVTQTLALAAQQILCSAPLLVAASAVARRATGRGIAGVLINVLGLYGTSATDVVTLFSFSSSASTTDLIVGLLTAAVFGTGVAATQQRGYEIIWRRPRAGMRSILRQWLWVVGLLAFVVVLLLSGRLGRLIGGHSTLGTVTAGGTQFTAALLFSWWSQHLLLGGRVSWRRLLPGAVCVAIGMTVLVTVSAVVLPGQITGTVDVYGPMGTTFVLAVWLVFLSGVVLGGALLGAVLVEGRGSTTDTPGGHTPPL